MNNNLVAIDEMDINQKTCIVELQKIGYFVLECPEISPSTADLHKWFTDAISSEHNQDLFNSGTIVKDQDLGNFVQLKAPMGERFLVNIDSFPQWTELFEKMKTAIGSYLPRKDYQFVDSVMLGSSDNCREQPGHVDWTWPDDSHYHSIVNRLPNEYPLVPLSALMSIQQGTRLKVWPGSHLIVERRIGKMMNETLSPITPIYITLEPGQIILYRGDLVHSGCSYTENNIRIFSYLDLPGVLRRRNETRLQIQCTHGYTKYLLNDKSVQILKRKKKDDDDWSPPKSEVRRSRFRNKPSKGIKEASRKSNRVKTINSGSE